MAVMVRKLADLSPHAQKKISAGRGPPGSRVDKRRRSSYHVYRKTPLFQESPVCPQRSVQFPRVDPCELLVEWQPRAAFGLIRTVQSNSRLRGRPGWAN